MRNHTDLTDRLRPIMGGQRIESGNGVDTFPVCTLGFSAVTSPGGDTVVVTASHCTEDVFGMDGGSTGLYQREGDDADDLIGSEAVDPDGFYCGYHNFCRMTDAASYSYTGPNDSVAFGYLARTESAGSGNTAGSVIIDDGENPFAIVGTTHAAVGDSVHKIGMIGGWTKGR